jgi:hypothetical protein
LRGAHSANPDAQLRIVSLGLATGCHAQMQRIGLGLLIATMADAALA